MKHRFHVPLRGVCRDDWAQRAGKITFLQPDSGNNEAATTYVSGCGAQHLNKDRAADETRLTPTHKDQVR